MQPPDEFRLAAAVAEMNLPAGSAVQWEELRVSLEVVPDKMYTRFTPAKLAAILGIWTERHGWLTSEGDLTEKGARVLRTKKEEI